MWNAEGEHDNALIIWTLAWSAFLILLIATGG